MPKHHNCRSRDAQALGRKPAYDKAESVRVNQILPPPPPRKPVASDSSMVDYLSGDTYKIDNSEPTPFSAPSHSSHHPSSPPSHGMSASPPAFTSPPVYDEPSKSEDQLPPAPWETQSTTVLPPPPSRYNQRQQFFEQQGTSHSSSGSNSSYDSLVGQAQNLSLNSSTPTKQEKPEDALFKDLVDFAKSKTSSSSKPNRSY